MGKIRFAQLSDTHLCREGKASYLGLPVREHFEEAINRLCRLEEPMDFVVVTGDIIDDGELEDYRFARHFFQRMQEKLGAPLFLTIGNHDNRENFFTGYLEEEPKANYCTVQNIGGLRLIVLDSVSGAVNGTIGAQQLAWLEKELATPAEQGTVLAFHHPLEVDDFMLGEHCVSDGDALYALARSSDVIAILTGHTHKCCQSTAPDTILCATADSTAYSLDVNGDDVSMLERFGYNMFAVENKKIYGSVVQLGTDKVYGRQSLRQMMEMIQQFEQAAALEPEKL